ncbi:MAG: methyltransferase domain-containing protein [Chloroflexota bacterium]|nr:methyltransferase domain-containing protein [Chloroflexota bacterium]
MTQANQDIWTEWLLERRFGGNADAMHDILTTLLYPIRDTVLKHTALRDGDILLDVGCGDGLIAFGALNQLPACSVIFSDISQDLLDHCQTLANRMHMGERCHFVQASADALTPIGSESVDAVTTRSVLIYVAAKQQALHEFSRVLKPGGHLSIFEPINRFGFPEPPQQFMGYDVSPVYELADKVKAVFGRIQPLDTDPMLNFDERDLLHFVEHAGFQDIHLELQVAVKPPERTDWEAMVHTAGNPKIPTLGEAIQEALTPDEARQFIGHLRPLVETRQGVQRTAAAYVWAVKA